MTLEDYCNSIIGKSLYEVDCMLDHLPYNEIYELWHEMTGNTLDFSTEPKRKQSKLKAAAKNFYRIDIITRTQLADLKADLQERTEKAMTNHPELKDEDKVDA